MVTGTPEPAAARREGGSRTPTVRVVVLNRNGARVLPRCLDALARMRWPSGRLDVVVVDNASGDGSERLVPERLPSARLVRATTNLGYGAGNNLALGDLDGVDYVALVNNDAFVDPGWLEHAVARLEADAGLGAACPKILFAPRFVELTVSAPASRRGRGDRRPLGVRVTGITVAGEDRFGETRFATGCYWRESDPRRGREWCWTGPDATLLVPLPGDGASAADAAVLLELDADRAKTARLAWTGGGADAAVGPAGTRVAVPLPPPGVDVIANVGSELLPGGYGADRGYQQIDRGQFDEPADVFAWCGAAVVLRAAYLEDVGRFDERLFLYYEDFDLSWRGRALGWRHVTAPASVVRHVHAATSTVGSRLFEHHVERSRLLVVAKNGSGPLVRRALVGSLRMTAGHASRDVGSELLHGARPRIGPTAARIRAFLGFLGESPAILRERRRSAGRVRDA